MLTIFPKHSFLFLENCLSLGVYLGLCKLDTRAMWLEALTVQGPFLVSTCCVPGLASRAKELWSPIPRKMFSDQQNVRPASRGGVSGTGDIRAKSFRWRAQV